MNVKFNQKSKMMEIEFQFKRCEGPESISQHSTLTMKYQGWYSTTESYP